MVGTELPRVPHMVVQTEDGAAGHGRHISRTCEGGGQDCWLSGLHRQALDQGPLLVDFKQPTVVRAFQLSRSL